MAENMQARRVKFLRCSAFRPTVFAVRLDFYYSTLVDICQLKSAWLFFRSHALFLVYSTPSNHHTGQRGYQRQSCHRKYRGYRKYLGAALGVFVEKQGEHRPVVAAGQAQAMQTIVFDISGTASGRTLMIRIITIGSSTRL